MLEAVTIREIEAIFTVTDRLGIHRESLVIPLDAAASRGACGACPTGRSRSWWSATASSTEFLASLEAELRPFCSASLARELTAAAGKPADDR